MTAVVEVSESAYHHKKWTSSAAPHPTLQDPGPIKKLSSETDQSQGAGHAHYSWDLTSGVPLLLTDGATSYLYNDTGTPVEQIDATGTALYYQHDQYGSTRLLTDTTGTVVAAFSYDPYGNLTGHTGTADTPLRWNGQYQDPGTGLYYLRARYYDPTTAQLLTRDPLAVLSGHPYAYAQDDPLNAADPAGLLCIGLHCLLNDVKAGARKAINSGVLTLGIGPDQVAVVYGELTSGFDCHVRGDRLECRGAASPFNGAPFTVGDVIMNPDRQPLSDDLFAHEARHSNQWALFGGWPFVTAYGLDLLIEGRCNSFERSAGFGRGGYSDCLPRSSSAAMSECSSIGDDLWADRTS